MKEIRTILVADDNADLADGFSVMLELEGFAVETVYSGKAALEKIKENRFDLAFIDIKMPDLSGIQVMKACNKKILTKIILMTGYRIEQVISEIFDKRPVRVNRISNSTLPDLDGTEGDDNEVLMLVGDAERLSRVVKEYYRNKNSSIMDCSGLSELTGCSIDADVLLLNMDGNLINSVILLDDIREKVSDVTKIILLLDMQDEQMKLESINSFEVAGCLFKPVEPEKVLTMVAGLTTI